jgi:magnesium-transporting ATPase (P-type)
MVRLIRDGSSVEVPIEDIVPGDVVVLKPGVVYCDMVVLKGYRVLVDESALTGESTPVLKAEFDRSMRYQTYIPPHHKMCTVSAGTEILEIDDNENALGLVMATGSFTAKGELLTDVLSYQRHKFQFDDEVKTVICILALEAVFMIALVFYFLNDDWVYSWFYGKSCFAQRNDCLKNRIAEPALPLHRSICPCNGSPTLASNCFRCFRKCFCKAPTGKTNQLSISPVDSPCG